MTVATLASWPLATSAAVVTVSAWQVIDWPGASEDRGQATGPSRSSVTVTSCSVTFPLLVTA